MRTFFHMHHKYPLSAGSYTAHIILVFLKNLLKNKAHTKPLALDGPFIDGDYAYNGAAVSTGICSSHWHAMPSRRILTNI